jgi:transcriptional regulator with XRE-family HTH domain
MLNDAVKDAIPTVPYAFRMDTLGERIRQQRLARGLSQEQLAQLVGVTKGAVSQWELGGTKNIKLITFQRLLDVLHTSPEYLLFGENRASSSGRFRALKRPGT